MARSIPISLIILAATFWKQLLSNMLSAPDMEALRVFLERTTRRFVSRRHNENLAHID